MKIKWVTKDVFVSFVTHLMGKNLFNQDRFTTKEISKNVPTV